MKDFIYCGISDIGIEKNVNQDAFLIKEIHIDDEPAVFGIVCDGLGGLSHGEKASASVVKRFRTWFIEEFPFIVNHSFSANDIFACWQDIILRANKKLLDYGTENGIRLGTTISGVLLYNQHFYCINVGDSRVYMIDDKAHQVTKDQSWIQKEIDAGRLTEQDAKNHPRQNVVLECIGAKKTVNPAFYYGDYTSEMVFLFCSDGFRHCITEDEMSTLFYPRILIDKTDIEKMLIKGINLVKNRKETDNITVGVIKCY